MTLAWAASLHDVAPATWRDCLGLLELLDGYGVPVSLLVTPHFHRTTRADADPAFAEALRARVARGDEVVLHGYAHVDDAPPPRSPLDWARRRWLTASEGEFAALRFDEARRRIAAGRAMLEALRLPPAGFVPPAWLLGPAARDALAASSLRYTCTRDVLLRLPGFEPIDAPSLVYSTRAAWRRTASRHWNRRRVEVLAHRPRVRVALHPAEARHPRVLDEWRSLLDALARVRTPALESAWLGPSPSAAAPATRVPAATA